MNIIKIYPKKSKVLLVGPVPPPLGGVSVHVKRLYEILKKEGYEVDIFFISRKHKSVFLSSIKLIKLIYLNNYDIIHIHGYYRAFILVIFFGRYIKKYCLLFTAHNPRLFENKTKLNQIIIKYFIKNLDCLIAVASHILENYKKNKVKLPGRYLVQNAFLPPPLEEEDKIFHNYDHATKKFILTHKPLIISNAWKIIFYKNTDLYGLDLCVELTSRLKKNFPKIGLLFALANKHVNADYVNYLYNRFKELGIEENFHFMTGQKELWPLFIKADLSIRPTATDGDALSIREALYLNCPVVASNVVKRPKGTVLFKYRDIDDLYCRVSDILDKLY
jgi:glycosyltransferase involved in cell wall biosynthesis